MTVKKRAGTNTMEMSSYFVSVLFLNSWVMFGCLQLDTLNFDGAEIREIGLWTANQTLTNSLMDGNTVDAKDSGGNCSWRSRSVSCV